MEEAFHISQKTLKILKNFNVINTAIIINPGNFLYTSRDSAIFAWAEIEESFPKEIAVNNLSELLSVISGFGDPDIYFEDAHIIIKKKRSRVRYNYTAPELLRDKFQSLPLNADMLPEDAEKIAPLSQNAVTQIRKLSSTLDLGLIELRVKSGKAMIRAYSGSVANPERSLEIGLAKDLDIKDFSMSIQLGNFCIDPDTYNVYIVRNKGIIFRNTGNLGVTYLIPLDIEPDSEE